MSVGQGLITGGFAGLQAAIGQSIGSVSAPGALGVALQANPSHTTTAINMTIVANGMPLGLVRSMSIDEEFNFQRVRAISSAVNVAFLPGVYEATAQINRAFLYGVSLENALGGGLRAVKGKYATDPDFTKFYFNIVECDNLGNAMATRHDCVLTSVRRAYEIDSVVVIDDASLLVRWSDVA